MAAGLRPDPLGELKRSPRHPSRKTGGLLLRGRKGKEGKGIGWEGRSGRGGEGKVKEGRGKEREGKGGRKEEGEGRGGGRGREMAPLTQIPGSDPSFLW